MQTEFYKLLENEDQPHLIFAHVHRRKNELEIALRKLNCDFDVKKATDEELLDLVAIDVFFRALSDLSLPRLCDLWIGTLEISIRKLTDESDKSRRLGLKLASRAMGCDGPDGSHFEYMRIVEPTEKKLHHLRADEEREAREAEAARLAAELAAMLAA